MKKYLSLKHLVGLLALITVFGMQSFQNAKDKVAKAEAEEMVWFLANDPENTDIVCEDNSNFQTNNGTTVQPSGCQEDLTFCCAKGYPLSDCDEISPGVFQLKANPLETPTILRYNPQ